MDKQTLTDYIHIKQQIKILENRLEKVRAKKLPIVADTVKSSASFPYAPSSVTIQGVDVLAHERKRRKIDKLIDTIEEMRTKALDAECEVYLYIQTIPDKELQNIIMLRYIDERTWEEVGNELCMHRTTAKRQVERFFKN